MKAIHRPLEPTKPQLLRLKNYNFVDFLKVDSWILFGFAFVYWMYLENAFETLDIYYLVFVFYILKRLWPFLVTNRQIRNKNKKLIDSYDKEVLKYKKNLKDYLVYDKERYRRTGQSDFLEISEVDALKTAEYFARKEKRKLESRNINKPSLVSSIHDNRLESEINNTIRIYSGICATLAIQPIPFADIFILTPTQILMGKEIASLRGYEIKENSIESILKEISGVIGMGIIAQQLLIGAYKTVLPFLGGITTIPAVYGLTYGIGKVMDYYIVAKINGNKINKNEIEKIFKFSREIGESEGKTKEKEIYAKSKQ